MSIFNSVGETIKKYGSRVTIEQNGDKVSTNAFVEPLRYRSRLYIGGQKRVLGRSMKRSYLYIGNPGYRLVENKSVIETQSGRYIVKRSETYYVKSFPVYEWAILFPYGERAEDDYDSN
ncbi:MAG TPA: hypothetical protein DEO32_02150 [Ruminococcaceae bacterium]|nr:hypothetical protein [Oscillospiraceae bacterium]